MMSVVAWSTEVTFTRTRERLVYFLISDDGVLIALYNDTYSAVVKLKDVTTDRYADWYRSIRPEVSLRPAYFEHVTTVQSSSRYRAGP